MPGPTPGGPVPADLFPMPGETPNPPEVPPSPGPIEDPVTEPDVIDPGGGTLVPGQEPDVPGMPGSRDDGVKVAATGSAMDHGRATGTPAMHTNPIKVIWLTIGRHLPGSDLVVSDFNVSRNGEAAGMTLSVQHPNRGNDDGNREEAMAFARALCREFGGEGPMEG